MNLLDRINRRLFAFVIVLLLVASAAVSGVALRLFERDLAPEIHAKGTTIARSLAGQIARAVGYGIAFEELTGVSDLFATVARDNPEVRFVAGVDARGHVTHHWGSAARDVIALARAMPPPEAGAESEERPVAGHFLATWPVVVDGRAVAEVVVGVDAFFVQEQMSEILYDLIVVLIVALLLTFELLILIRANVQGPIEGLQRLVARVAAGDLQPMRGLRADDALGRIVGKANAVLTRIHETYTALGERVAGRSAEAAPDAPAARGAVAAIRTPLFVFFFAEEMSRSFFPVFARELHQPIAGLSIELAVSLPMVLFMLIVAVSQPIAGSWAERIGQRRLFVLGAAFGTGGLALTALAGGLGELIAWRCLTALGYGLVFVAGQSWVVATTDESNRSYGMALFVGGVLAASICGTAIGGILADRIGYSGTFLVGACLAALAGLLVLRLLPGEAGAAAPARRMGAIGDLKGLLRSPRFMAIVLLGAMPAKIVLTGFLYFLAPLYLAELGNTPSAIGRFMMLYGLVMVLVTPLAARLADRAGRPMPFIVLGGAASGLGLMGVLVQADTLVVVVAILVLGLAQAASITPQLALVPSAPRADGREVAEAVVLGYFRLFERLGSAAGPAIAAALLTRFGYADALVLLGAGVIAASVLLALVWRLVGPLPVGDTRQAGLAGAAYADPS
jgi:predicted MFS family arabinose efflux permease